MYGLLTELRIEATLESADVKGGPTRLLLLDHTSITLRPEHYSYLEFAA